MAAHRYLLALGSNLRHARHGRPRAVLRAALAALGQRGIVVACASPIIETAPLGPSRRRYANAAAVVFASLDPPQLLAALKSIEHAFGRRKGGMRWRARVLDLDIILWSAGRYEDRTLAIPHRSFRERAFVLVPATRIAPDWRDPVTGLTLRNLTTRLTRARPALRAHPPARGVGPLAQSVEQLTFNQ